MIRPKVSVVIPLYNAEEYIQSSVESILNQTFRDFELIIINDAATDSGRKIVGAINDPRIRIVDHSKNQGLVASLNHGFSLCSGEYIARMDHDDVARPDRFEKQVRFLDAHPDIALLGSWFEYIGKGIVIKSPVTSEEIRYYSLFNSPFGHPTVMIRKSALSSFHGPYDPDFNMAEDYDLWCRIIDSQKTANLPEILLDYRIHPQQMSAQSSVQKKVADRIRLRQFRKMVGISFGFENKAFAKVMDRAPVRPLYRPFFKIWFVSVLVRSLFSGFLSPKFVLRFYKEN
jgi:glycosyltransferase involved in cell wall biosynthesis